MVCVMREKILLVLMVFVLLTSLPRICIGENYTISSVIIDLYYDIDSGSGYVNQTVIITWSGSPPLTVNIPILKPPSKGRYEVLNCTNSRGDPLPFTINANNTVTVMINNSYIVKISYMIYNYFDEVSPGMYVAMFDLLDYEKVNYLQLSLILPSDYKVVDVEPSDGTSISTVGGTTRIVFSRPQIYFIVVSLVSIETPTTTTPTTTTSGEGETTTFLGYIPFIILGVLVLGGFLLYIHFRRKYSIEIEALPSSILEDDTSKKIIEILGKAGDKGVKQSELVRLTGRPKSSISRRVRRLAEEGYVEIIRAGKHNIIKLTSKGLETYRNMKKGG